MTIKNVDGISRGHAIASKLLPRIEGSAVAVEAPGEGEGFWVGAPSAVEYDGYIYMAYRLRRPIALGRGGGIVIARSQDGENFEIITTIGKDEMDAESLERPTLIRTPGGRWRLYLSCATWNSKHWRVEVLEADDPANFDPSQRRVVLAGDENWGVKDTVIAQRDGKWHLWATMHPLDIPDHEDRMVSDYATSDDGIEWEWQGTALRGRDGMWDSRGARVTAVHFADDMVIALYDGRASADENYEERTGVAIGTDPGNLIPIGNEPFGQSAEGKALRYVDLVPLSDGGYRLYYEIARPDGSHELRTEVVA